MLWREAERPQHRPAARRLDGAAEPVTQPAHDREATPPATVRAGRVVPMDDRPHSVHRGASQSDKVEKGWLLVASQRQCRWAWATGAREQRAGVQVSERAMGSTVRR